MAAGTNRKKNKNKTRVFRFLAYSPRRQEGEGQGGGRTHLRHVQGEAGKHQTLSNLYPSRTHGGERAESRDQRAESRDQRAGPPGGVVAFCGLCSEQ